MRHLPALVVLVLAGACLSASPGEQDVPAAEGEPPGDGSGSALPVAHGLDALSPLASQRPPVRRRGRQGRGPVHIMDLAGRGDTVFLGAFGGAFAVDVAEPERLRLVTLPEGRRLYSIESGEDDVVAAGLIAAIEAALGRYPVERLDHVARRAARLATDDTMSPSKTSAAPSRT